MRTNSPVISIVIPFFKDGQFLAETIESVLQQSFTDWELLLIDDGSPDNSAAIAQQYAAQHPDKVFYLSHPQRVNKGVAAARNLGIRKARAEWIAFLDADDVWLPERLSRQWQLVGQHPQCALFCEATTYWHTWTDDGDNDRVIYVGDGLEGVFEAPVLLSYLYPLAIGAAPCTCTLLIKKQALQAIGGFEESFKGVYQLYEDQALLAKIYAQFPVYISKDNNNRYRQHPDSCMHNPHIISRYHEVRQYFLDFFEDYLHAKNLATEPVRKALHKARMPYKKGLFNSVGRLLYKTASYLNK